MKLMKMVLIFWFLSCLSSTAVFACRFNVRDVGFVDLENQPYLLFCYINNSTEKHVTDDYKEIAAAQLSQTNIKAITVNIDQTSDHPAMKYLSPDAKNFPVFILLSPSEQVMQINSVDTGQGFKGRLQGALKEIVSSSMRQEIIEKTIDSFGVVLIIEGPDAEENKQAVTAAQAAIKKITNQMGWLPKAISKPPVLVELKAEQQQQEKILLWSMGIDADNIKKAHAIILYGRGRRMGPVLSGKLFTGEMLTKLLSVIGADCECGLDRSWMQGNMMPAKWDSERLKKLSELLGFDTEHPMVKMEMSQIIRKGKPVGDAPPDIDAIGGFGYQEIEIKFDDPADKPASAQEPAPISNNDPPPQLPVEQAEVEEDEFQLWNPLYLVGITGAVVLLASIYFIYASGKKR